jgi:hypothetical protein
MKRRIDGAGIYRDWMAGMTIGEICPKRHVNVYTVYAVLQICPFATDDEYNRIAQSVFNRSQSGKMWSHNIHKRVAEMWAKMLKEGRL